MSSRVTNSFSHFMERFIYHSPSLFWNVFKKKRKKFEKQYAWSQLAIGSSCPATTKFSSTFYKRLQGIQRGAVCQWHTIRRRPSRQARPKPLCAALRRERNPYAGGRIFGGEWRNVPVEHFSRGPLLQEKRGPFSFLMPFPSVPTKWESESSKPLRAEIMGNFVSVLALPSAILAIGFARQLAFGLRFACRLQGLLAPAPLAKGTKSLWKPYGRSAPYN